MTILGSLSTMGNVKPTSMTRSSFGGSSFGGSSQSANNVACGGCGGNGINIDANVNVNLGGLLENLKNDNSMNSKPFKEFVIEQCIKTDLNNSKYRKIIIAQDWEEFLVQKYIVESPLNGTNNLKNIIFLFGAQGDQTPTMGMKLYDHFSAYSSTIDKLDGLFKQYIGYSVINKLLDIPKGSKEIFDQSVAQPSLTLYTIGMFELYKHFNINPSIVFGLSFGEIGCMYAANCLSMENIVKLVYHRSTIQSLSTGNGCMILIREKQGLLDSRYHTNELEVAGRFPRTIVYNATKESANSLKRILDQDGVKNHIIPLPGKFHSRAQKPLKPKILESLSHLNFDRPSIKWYSTVTGELSSEKVDANYIYKNIRKPFLFDSALSSIIRENQIDECAFLVISPGTDYSNHIYSVLQNATIISMSKSTDDEVTSFLMTLGKLFCNGFNNINFLSQFPEFA
ncbi:fatty acid synthase [Heterostelium album PN500]|uniref:Fatty acid synthase n=1 Tax=Heterostelium pallidum (strain ATCC 26659 / Pp 5 / PN500) TaxID=670386 RepID=D3BEF9_HETP5|nr:fatty acid synthase [Heterostelium album PN500]EFA80290.1 fatty acid synthase [Heterostelium album PN500]|eukprot:XP_020432410.1 fatty acid synthase [Heterostelium album PN500]